MNDKTEVADESPRPKSREQIITPRTESLATASLVCAHFGFNLLGPLGSALGIVFSRIAQHRILRSGGRLVGLERARIGMVIGLIGAVIWAIIIIAVLANT